MRPEGEMMAKIHYNIMEEDNGWGHLDFTKCRIRKLPKTKTKESN